MGMRILSTYFRMLVICCLSCIIMKRCTTLFNIMRNLEFTDKHTVLFNDSHTVHKTELEMNVKRYFAKRSRIQNSYYHPLSTNGSKICDGNDPPFLIIMCLSLPGNVKTRQTIRNTWASPIRSKQWPTDKKIRISGVKLVFVFGETNSSQDKKIIKKESELFGDVVKADFVDTYRNLTRKVIVGMHWAVNFCQGFKYLMKTDEDTFINIRNALLYLQSLIVNEKGVIIGALNNSSGVSRTGKWGVTTFEYPYDHYPDYISGQTYVVSGNIVPKLIHTARYLPYFYLEDVFITGIVRVIAGADFIDEKKRFPHQFDKIPRICQFFKSTRISATNVNNKHKVAIWYQLLYSHRRCKE